MKPTRWQAAHGLGYTRFEAEHDGVQAELLYFVGELADCVTWRLRLKNASAVVKDIDLFSFVEFGMMEFMRELSWCCYNKHQISVDFDGTSQAIVYHYTVEMQPKPKETPLVYMASDQPLVGYDGDRDEFVGNYRSESNPLAIELDGCTNSTLKGGDPCGALQMRVCLKPGESKTINTYLGTAPTMAALRTALEICRQPDFADRSLARLKDGWERYLGRFSCELPDAEAQRQINLWNPYQRTAISCFPGTSPTTPPARSAAWGSVIHRRTYSRSLLWTMRRPRPRSVSC